MQSRDSRVSVLLVQQETLFREALAQILELESDLSVVAMTGDFSSAVALARQVRPHVVVLSSCFVELDAAAQARRIREVSAESRIMVLIGQGMHVDIAVLLSAGMSCLLSVLSTRSQFTQAIRDVRHGGQETVLYTTGESLGPPAGADDDRLTAREGEVLRLVAAGLSNRQIAVQLSIAEGTVKRHLRKVFDKLGAQSRIDALNKAGLGRARLAGHI
ncbi:MAG TPA: response regulator transcription factor [Streptosporangiaceae bacterium]|jgi:DNA-binding NarL/FixJ family response regulator